MEYQVYHDDPVLLLEDTAANRVADQGVSLGFNRAGSFLYGAIKGAATNSDQSKFDGYLAFFTTSENSFHQEWMRITSLGNVGIGTTSPQARLDVAGDVAVSGNRQFVTRYENGSNAHSGSLGWSWLQLGNNGANYIIGGRDATGGSLIFVTDQTNDFSYGDTPNGREVMRLTNSGNVGIGTNNPSGKLHVANGNDTYAFMLAAC